MKCSYGLPGLTTVSQLQSILNDPIKIFAIRFFDDKSPSVSTHELWTSIDGQLGRDQKYANIIPYQIDCNSTVEAGKYCQKMKIDTTPEILAIRENSIFAYFTQKRVPKDMTVKTILEFIDELQAVDPLVKVKIQSFS